MTDTSTVTNTKTVQSAIISRGEVILKENASVKNNKSDGIYIIGESGSLLLKDNATINNNLTGINSSGKVIMQDNASIHNNLQGARVGGTFELQGGSIYGNGDEEKTDFWRMASAVDCTGIFRMSGGSIYDNVAYNENESTIYISSGSFIMTGGEIYRNHHHNTLTGATLQFEFQSSFDFLGGKIYGSVETGVPETLANSSTGEWTAIRIRGSYTLKYGDGTNILPHIEGSRLGTNYTIVGRM